MPGMSGLEVLEEIKGSEKTRDIPVVMLSALSDLGTIRKCMDKGAIDYIPKPFDKELLLNRIRTCLA
jgi:CheY-like chemotaxis protein